MAEFGTLKVGDICKVVKNSNGHDYEIGEELSLYLIWDDNQTTKKTIKFGNGFLAEDLDGTRRDGNILREIDLEKVENMDKMKEFTKSDLKEFDEVVFRNGNKNVFYQGEFRGDMPRNIDYYRENLLRNDSESHVDVMQVIRNKEVIWERIEKSPMQIKLEELEKQQRAIADEIAKLREEN